MMKRILLLVVVLVGGFLQTANATLIDQGEGLVYDDVLNVTWLKDANYAKTSNWDSDGKMTWTQATAWIASLNSSNFKGHNDWRLARNLPMDGVSWDYEWRYDGLADQGYNITLPASELSYMFYVNLGNLGQRDQFGNPRADGTWGLLNTDPFVNVENPSSFGYWSGSELWKFNFQYGFQEWISPGLTLFAWAVRDGDTDPVPEPASMFLLGSGLIGIACFRRKFGKVH